MLSDPAATARALDALRRARDETDLLAFAAGRLAADTQWESRAADRYRELVATWRAEVRQVRAELDHLADVLRDEGGAGG